MLLIEKPAPCSKRQYLYCESDTDVTLYGGAAGSGKALRHGSKVLTPKGWVNIESINIGDQVIGIDNSLQTVFDVSPQGSVEIYRVTFQDGATVDCCENHLWKVRKAGDGFKRKATILKTTALKQFCDGEKLKSGRKRHLICDLVAPIEFSEKELPVAPYTLGALLGDGSLSGDSVRFTSIDPEILNNIVLDGYEVTQHKGRDDSFGILKLQDAINDLGLQTTSFGKFIPKEYKNSSVEQRFSLVQGLMDTDGTVDKTSALSYCTVSHQLALDVQEVVRSLGGTATISEKLPFYTKGGERVYCKKAYILHIRHPESAKFFRLGRKLSRCKSESKPIGNRVLSVENLGIKDFATCISISGEDHQFITDNYIVTHNSEIAVIDLCKYVRIPNFIGIVSRRTTPMLKGAGGILTKCKRTFAKEFKKDPDYTYQWKEKDNKFVFYKWEKDETIGKRIAVQVSEVYLKHSEHEALIEEYWQGVEANLICVDETTQYTLPMIQYIMSRMRNPSCPEVRPRLKMTCNPMFSHFLKDWVVPYLKEDGTPDRTKDGLIRYFTFYNGDFIWGDSKQSVVDQTDCKLEDVLSFTFISATVADNKILQEIDPRYVSWLKGLKGVDRKRLLEGNWYAKEDATSYFDRATVHELDSPPPHTEFSQVVRAYDLAGIMPSDANRNPDYTVSVKMGKLKNTGDYVILEVLKCRIKFGDWERHILENARRDGPRVDIVIPQDPGIQAKANAIRLARKINEAGFPCTVRRASEGKLEAFKPFAACAQLGTVSIVKGCGSDTFNDKYNTLEFYYRELEVFTGIRSNKKEGHDDCVDATSLAFILLSARYKLPSGWQKGMKAMSIQNDNPLLDI